MLLRKERDVEYFNKLGHEHLPEYLGVVITEIQEGNLPATMVLKKQLGQRRKPDFSKFVRGLTNNNNR